jgi:hypothetical protein
MPIDKRPEEIPEKNLPERRSPGVVSDPDRVAVPVGKPLEIEEAKPSTEEEPDQNRSDRSDR